MHIEHVKGIFNTPALKLAVAGWHEILESGHCGLGAMMVGWEQNAVIMIDDDTTEAIGVLTWSDSEWAKIIYVGIAYVVPAQRRHGIHGWMWRALVEKAKDMGRVEINSSVSDGNDASLASMMSQGREITGQTVRYMVTP